MSRSRLSAAILLALLVSMSFASAAQAQNGSARVEVTDAGTPVQGATVFAGTQTGTTDASGIATLSLPAGSSVVVAVKDGYEPATGGVVIVAGQEQRITLVVLPRPMSRGDETVVSSSRIPRRLQDQPIPMETMGRSQIEPQVMMSPGNIAMLLGRLPSVRMQTTSPELGLMMPRVRGLRGHYTRMLSDGVVLDFDHPGGLGVMQFPTMDLGQVELVTEGASALFGANAAAGSINLLSRLPGAKKEHEFLFNQSFEGGTDGAFWMASPPTGSWSNTLLVSGHFQDERDRDDDGWSDIAGYNRGHARTRVMWNNRRGRFASGTAGVTFEKREGGSSFAHQQLETKEADGALFGQMPLGKYVLAGAGTLFVQSRVRDFAEVREHERRQSATMELTLRRTGTRNTWLAGIESDWFAIRSEQAITSKYVSTRPAIFFHDELQVSPRFFLSGSARIDYHNLYDLVLSPRGSAMFKNGGFAARISGGQSYFAPFPPPYNEDTEAGGLTLLTIAEPLEKETATNVAFDLSHTTASSVVSFTWFHTRIENPALVNRTTYTLYTDENPLTADGVQLLGTVRKGPLSITGTYAYTVTEERGEFDVALTPTHRGSILASFHKTDRFRAGVEIDFTGEQQLDANPYRSVSEPYTTVNLLLEVPMNRVSFFINGENLTDVRQTDWDPIARTSPGVDGRWTVDAWAPLRGRIINIGFRARF